MGDEHRIEGWRQDSERIGKGWRNHGRPLVFFLGAGCSMSSGCPSEDAVAEAVSHVPGRQRPGSPDEHVVHAAEKKQAIDALFRGRSPNVGYYCLAGLGRVHRVFVLSLNGDNLVEEAAKALGVVCISKDVADAAKVLEEWSTLPKCGVVVLHLHGTLENPRYTQNEVSGYSDDEKKLISKICRRNSVVFLGTSLRRASDIADVLSNTENVTGNFMNRKDTFSNETDELVRSAEFSGVFGNRTWTEPDFDFDAFMLHSAGAARNRLYDKFRNTGDRSHLNLPRLQETGLAHEVLRLALRNIRSHGVALITGPPHVGKSIAGNIVAYCLALCDEEKSGKSMCYSGGGPTLEALATPSKSEGISSLLLLHPLSVGTPNDPFFHRLIKAKHNSLEGPSVVACCRESNLPFDQSIENQGIRELLVSIEEWYSLDDLRWIGAKKGLPDQVLGRAEDYLRNPGWFFMNLGRECRPGGRPGGMNEFVAHYLALLKADDGAAWRCVLLRLSEFAGRSKTRSCRMNQMAASPSDRAS